MLTQADVVFKSRGLQGFPVGQMNCLLGWVA